MTYKNIKTKNDFLPFKVGTIFNPLNIKIKKKSPLLKEIKIEYPTRLNAMALDPRKIAFNNNFVYTPGEIVFVTKIYKKINVKLIPSKKLVISERSERKSLIKHSFLLMKRAIGFKNGLYIDVQNTTEIRHAGLGSSGSLIAGVAAAINEIFGNQINKEKLIRYLAQNHGEEIDGSPNLLNPVQCIGGSAAAGLFKKGGLIIIAGEASIIKTMNINNNYTVVLGIPNDFKQVDSKMALGEELKKIQGFINSGNKYAEKIAYNVLHSVLPSMTNNNLKIIGDIIYEYRYNMGSIKNCSFLYQKLPKLMKKISFLKTKGIADVLSISSVGPTVFTITKRPDICVDIFKRNNLNVYITKIENNGYKINKNFLNNNSLFRKQRCLWNSKKIIRLFRDKKPSGYIKKQLKNIKNPKDKKALDLGCGTGRYTELMLKVGFNVNVLDYSKTMLDITKTKMLKFYDKNEVRKRCKKSLIINIPFPNKYFDLIISAGVFHQAYSINDYNQAIKECARVLKKGGILISEIFTSKIIDKKLKRVGARTVKTKEGLFMTLLSKEEFIKMVSKYNLKLKGRTVENIKQIETGVRCILRSTFYKK